MSFSLAGFFSFLVSFQLFFAAVFLFSHKKGNKRNNWLLGLVFLLFSISLADFAIRVFGLEIPVKSLHLLDDGFFFLYGPLLYFYVQGVVYNDFKFKSIHFLHFLIFALYLVYLIYMFIALDVQNQNQLTDKILRSDLPSWIFLAGSLIYFYIFIYLWYSWQTISRYRSVIRDRFSAIEKINLDWLRFMIRAFTAIAFIAMVHNVLPALGNIYFQVGSLMALLVFSFYFINRVLLKALNQPEIFSGISLGDTRKYAGSNLRQDEIDDISDQLKKVMEKDRLFLDPDLTIKDLAEKLDTTPKTLSQVINQSYGMNFFDFVNSYRCEEVKQILNGPDEKITILEAMYQSGFNSKSSFNKEFKKLTGETPSQYRKSGKRSAEN